MGPSLSQKNREQLFFLHFMDCQTPRKPGGGPNQTWDIAERAVRGIADLGNVHPLGAGTWHFLAENGRLIAAHQHVVAGFVLGHTTLDQCCDAYLVVDQHEAAAAAAEPGVLAGITASPVDDT